MSSNHSGERLRLRREIVVFATAVIALINSVVGLWLAIEQRMKQNITDKKVEKTVRDIEELRDCRGEITLDIVQPSKGDHLRSLPLSVSGTATPHEFCYHVFVFTRNASRAGAKWFVAGQAQVSPSGTWDVPIGLDGVNVGDLVEIDARVTSDPSAYGLHQTINHAPNRGVRSNIVDARRLQ